MRPSRRILAVHTRYLYARRVDADDIPAPALSLLPLGYCLESLRDGFPIESREEREA